MNQYRFKLVIFKVDCTELHKSFLCGSIHQYLFEHENNFIIRIGDVFYGPLKEKCEKF
ncbi:hypothetical protein ACQPUZ_16460 [Clostridium tertium]|uniref:hypothetical protein n=1 Tax=Clostridium nigeriense TaxID=1805470 RepID=UPI003D344DF8